MIKVDRKNHICELSGSSNEILIDVQFALHKAVHNAVVKKTAGTLQRLLKQCATRLRIRLLILKSLSRVSSKKIRTIRR